MDTKKSLEKLGLPSHDLHKLPTSKKCFPDGAHYRIEIPSTETPEQLQRVVENADRLKVKIQRISQGSGVTMLTDQQVKEMASIGAREKLEISLFVGPRASYDIGGMVKAPSGLVVAGRLRGADQLAYAIDDVKRGIDLGIRSFLVVDEGLLWTLNELRKQGEIPKDVILKVSIVAGQNNPASAKLLENLGADTLNLATDLTLPQIAAIRQAVNIPLDLYAVAPGQFGGFIRLPEVHEMIRVASPVYLKFGIPLSNPVYPAGEHIKSTLLGFADEEVRLAKIGQDLIKRRAPNLKTSERGAKGLAIPKPPKKN